MLQRIYLAIAGSANPSPDGPLEKSGANDTVIIATDIQKTGHVPSVIFTDGVLSAIQSAHVMGGVLGVFNFVHDKRLAWRYPHGAFSDKHDPFRAHFRSPQAARKFLNERCRLKPEDETVLFMTDRCWGNTFGRGSWPRSSLYCFDVPSQSLKFVAYPGSGM